jgi:hypothetical protein
VAANSEQFRNVNARPRSAVSYEWSQIFAPRSSCQPLFHRSECFRRDALAVIAAEAIGADASFFVLPY